MEAHKEKSDDSANHHGGLDMSFVETCTEMLVSAIRNGSTYKEYCAALDAVFKIPGLKEQVDEIRRLNYRCRMQAKKQSCTRRWMTWTKKWMHCPGYRK